MRNVSKQVWHFPSTETGSYLLTDVLGFNITDGTNNAPGNYTVTVNNIGGQYKTDSLVPVDYGDILKIEVSEDSASYRPLVLGKIEDEGYDLSIGRNVKVIKGFSLNKEFQNYMISDSVESGLTYSDGTITYDYDSISSRGVLKFIINEHINGASAGFLNIDFTDYVDSNSGCKLWKTQIGADFYKAWTNTTVGTVLDEISTNEFTGNGDYLFYIDEEYKVHFEPKGFITSTINLEEGVNIIDYKLNRSIKPKYNAVIVFCGNRADGKPINVAGYNGKIVSEYNGFKWGYVNRGNLYNNIKSSFPLYTEDELIAKTKKDGKIIARNLSATEGEPLWKGGIKLKGSSYYTLSSGLDININLPTAGNSFENVKFNLEGVKQSFKNNSWQTTVNLAEKRDES